MMWVLTSGWTEHVVLGDGEVCSISHMVRRKFADDVELREAKAELRKVIEREEAEADARVPGRLPRKKARAK